MIIIVHFFYLLPLGALFFLAKSIDGPKRAHSFVSFLTLFLTFWVGAFILFIGFEYIFLMLTGVYRTLHYLVPSVLSIITAIPLVIEPFIAPPREVLHSFVISIIIALIGIIFSSIFWASAIGFIAAVVAYFIFRDNVKEPLWYLNKFGVLYNKYFGMVVTILCYVEAYMQANASSILFFFY